MQRFSSAGQGQHQQCKPFKQYEQQFWFRAYGQQQRGKLVKSRVSQVQQVTTDEATSNSNGQTEQNFNKPCQEDVQQLLDKASGLLCDYLVEQKDITKPVVKYVPPEKMREIFSDRGVPLELKDGDEPISQAQLLTAVESILEYSVRTGHPLFFNQLYGRVEAPPVIGDWMATVINTSVYTYEVAPVLTLVEQQVIMKAGRLAGGVYADFCEGLFVPGGSLSNLYGMNLARYRAFPDIKKKGMQAAPPLVAFTSDKSHYSLDKNSRLTGLGTDNLFKVATDEAGRMIPAELDKALTESKAQGKVPFLVNATSGTTVQGAYDPLNDIADICEKHGVWMHVDACYGASMLMTPQHRHLVSGIERADSFCWNPHKMMGLPLQCSMFVTKHGGMLQNCNGTQAEYLFQPDKLNACLDVGDITIQCGRKADCLKLWMAWKAIGDDGYAERVNRCVRLATYMEEQINKRPRFQMVCPRHANNICFWYLPKSMEQFNPDTATKEEWEQLHKVAPVIKEAMQHGGMAMIGFNPMGPEWPNFFRQVYSNALTLNEDDVDGILDQIDELGRHL